jgi:hypothetical protein
MRCASKRIPARAPIGPIRAAEEANGAYPCVFSANAG